MLEKLNLPETVAETHISFDQDFIDLIKRLEAEGRNIGSGRTATVMVLEAEPGICLKAVHDKTISRNKVDEEVRFLDRANKVGVRVPKPLGSLRTETNDYLMMETIDGVNVKDLIEQDLLERLPENFDFKKFFDDLRNEIKKMNGAKIHHRDLHGGNVMIDKEGNPVIIDFGDAKVHLISGEDPYREVNGKGDLVVYPRDEVKVTELYRQLGTYLRDKGFFQNIK